MCVFNIFLIELIRFDHYPGNNKFPYKERHLYLCVKDYYINVFVGMFLLRVQEIEKGQFEYGMRITSVIVVYPVSYAKTINKQLTEKI